MQSRSLPRRWKLTCLLSSLIVLSLLLMGATLPSYNDAPVLLAPLQQAESSGGGIGAILIAILITIVMVLAILLLEMLRLIFDRALLKRVLAGDFLLGQLLPSMARYSEDRALSSEERTGLHGAMQHLLPTDWATGQTDSALDAIYDFVGDKEQPYPQISLELDPLLRALQGKPGQQAIRHLVDGLPNCPGKRAMPTPGLFGLPSCVPSQMSRRRLTAEIQKNIRRTVNTRLRGIRGAKVLDIEQLERLTNQSHDETSIVRQRFNDLRKSLVRTRYISVGLWVGAILGICLLIYLVGLSSVSVYGAWLGWPAIVISIVLIAAFFFIPRNLRKQLDSLGEGEAVEKWLAEPIRLWQRRMAVWWGSLLVVGIVLLALAYSA